MPVGVSRKPSSTRRLRLPDVPWLSPDAFIFRQVAIIASREGCGVSGREDRAAREAMIATCRKMNASGLNQGTSGNLSLRVEEGFLLTPTGMDYDALTPEDIVLMRLDG